MVALRTEHELSGDDPVSRKASSRESLSEAELDAGLKELIAIFDKAGSYPKGRGADQDPSPVCIEKEYIKSKHSGLHTIRLKSQKP